ncbi:hypothetical protein WA158_006526 [Blastocystis sp. Blastoise]
MGLFKSNPAPIPVDDLMHLAAIECEKATNTKRNTSIKKTKDLLRVISDDACRVDNDVTQIIKLSKECVAFKVLSNSLRVCKDRTNDLKKNNEVPADLVTDVATILFCKSKIESQYLNRVCLALEEKFGERTCNALKKGNNVHADALDAFSSTIISDEEKGAFLIDLLNKNQFVPSMYSLDISLYKISLFSILYFSSIFTFVFTLDARAQELIDLAQPSVPSIDSPSNGGNQTPSYPPSYGGNQTPAYPPPYGGNQTPAYPPSYGGNQAYPPYGNQTPAYPPPYGNQTPSPFPAPYGSQTPSSLPPYNNNAPSPFPAPYGNQTPSSLPPPTANTFQEPSFPPTGPIHNNDIPTGMTHDGCPNCGYQGNNNMPPPGPMNNIPMGFNALPPVSSQPTNINQYGSLPPAPNSNYGNAPNIFGI